MAAQRKRRAQNSRKSAPSKFPRFGSYRNIIAFTKRGSKRIVTFVDKRPLASFFSVLLILLLLIVIGSFLRRPKQATTQAPPLKEVSIYSVGTSPTIKVQAQIEKTGVVKVVALTPGVVSEINVEEGQEVAKGTSLVSLASNYSGGNAASVQRQIAATSYQNAKDTYDTQKDIIAKQRDLAGKQEENAEQLRDITSKSIDETQSLLNLNNDILNTIKSNIETLQNNNGNQQDIQSLKQLQAQLQSGTNQLQQGLRNSQYQAGNDNPPAEIARIQKDITLKQLDVQEKALSLGLETSRLQLRLAQIQEATMYPVAPINGVIEKVYVTPYQSVNPGTPLVLLHGEQNLTAIAKVPHDIAVKASYTDPSTIAIGSQHFEAVPTYISTEATDGSLYSIYYSVPQEYQDALYNSEYITIEVPVGFASTSSSVPFIPLDAIYKSTNGTYIFVDEKGVARARTIRLGAIVGKYAEVTTGLRVSDKVILTRDVISGDKVSAQ